MYRITTSFEAWAVIYAIAAGAVARGIDYLKKYPGYLGWTLAAASLVVVFLVGNFILETVKEKKAAKLAEASSE